MGVGQLLLALGLHFGEASHKLKAPCNCIALLEKRRPSHLLSG